MAKESKQPIPGRILDNLLKLREAMAREAFTCSGLHHILVGHNDDLTSDVLYGPEGFVSPEEQHRHIVITPDRGSLEIISWEGMAVLQAPVWTDRGKQYRLEPMTFNWNPESRRELIAKAGIVATGFLLTKHLDQEVSHRRNRFESLAGDIIRCLDRVSDQPQLATVGIYDRLNREGGRTRDRQAQWMRIVHRLGWQGHTLSLMGATRQTWLRNPSGGMIFLPFDAEQLTAMLDMAGPFAGLKARISVPPDRFVSELAHDVFTESAYAIDDILTLASGEPLGPGTRAGVARSTVNSRPKEQVFVSYSHSDESQLRDILRMLAPAIRNGTIEVWYDQKIKPGDVWRREIDQAMDSAAIGLLLVTENFLESNFINNHELPFLVKSSIEHGVRLLWISVGHCLHEQTQLAEIQSLNDPAKPLKGMNKQKRDKELKRICQEIIRHYGQVTDKKTPSR